MNSAFGKIFAREKGEDNKGLSISPSFWGYCVQCAGIRRTYPFLWAICQTQCRCRVFSSDFEEVKSKGDDRWLAETYDAAGLADPAPVRRLDMDMLVDQVRLSGQAEKQYKTTRRTTLMIPVVPAPMFNGIIRHTGSQWLGIAATVLLDQPVRWMNQSDRKRERGCEVGIANDSGREHPPIITRLLEDRCQFPNSRNSYYLRGGGIRESWKNSWASWSR